MADEKVLDQDIMEPEEPEKKKKKIGLTTQIFIGLLAGLAVGLIFNRSFRAATSVTPFS